MNFLRRMTARHSKLGKGRKKKQTWRKPTGRHNKMRLGRKGVPATVKIGYKKTSEDAPKLVYTLKELESVNPGQKIMLGKVGAKKKLDIVKKAKEMKIEIQNINTNKVIKKFSKVKSEVKTSEGKK